MALDTDIDSDEQAFLSDMAAIDAEEGGARASLKAILDTVDDIQKQTAADPGYSIHDVTGVGRYAVIVRTGWEPLIRMIRPRSKKDPHVNIDFSTKDYPSFDKIIGAHFQSPYLLDPLNDHYESYGNLRDNLAAVRNFLMETYYADIADKMPPEKAKKALEEIAAFIGDGLDNNNLSFFGFIRTHDSSKSFINLQRAMKPNGVGAQYIYECVLERNRRNSWARPFSAIKEFFGGQAGPIDWTMPPAHETEFEQIIASDIAQINPDNQPSEANIASEIQHINMLEATRQKRLDEYKVNLVAQDLNAIGNELFGTVNSLQNVQALSEPVRHDAIEIAKDILRKLKISLGNLNILDGLKLPPMEDAATLGSLKGVAMVYERMVQWARSADPTVMQDPSVIAATQAIGKLGYLAKLEAYRFARTAENYKLAESIAEQLKSIPDVYRTGREAKFSQLLDQVENGMNTILNRVQTLSGPGSQIGLAANDLGGNVSAAPTAGLGMQGSQLGKPDPNAAQKQNAALLAAEQQLHQSQQNRQPPQAARTEAKTGTPIAPSRPPLGRTATTQTVKPARTTSPSATAPLNPTNPIQRQQQVMRNNLHHEQEEHEHHEAQMRELQRQNILLAQQKAAAAAQKVKATAQKIDPNVLKGFQNLNPKGLGTPVNPGYQTSHVAALKQAPLHPNDPHHDDHLPPLNTPNKGGRNL